MAWLFSSPSIWPECAGQTLERINACFQHDSCFSFMNEIRLLMEVKKTNSFHLNVQLVCPSFKSLWRGRLSTSCWVMEDVDTWKRMDAIWRVVARRKWKENGHSECKKESTQDSSGRLLFYLGKQSEAKRPAKECFVLQRTVFWSPAFRPECCSFTFFSCRHFLESHKSKMVKTQYFILLEAARQTAWKEALRSQANCQSTLEWYL